MKSLESVHRALFSRASLRPPSRGQQLQIVAGRPQLAATVEKCQLSQASQTAQQCIAFHRFSSSAGDMERIRRLLGYKNADDKFYPRPMQILIWQIPVIMPRFGVSGK